MKFDVVRFSLAKIFKEILCILIKAVLEENLCLCNGLIHCFLFPMRDMRCTDFLLKVGDFRSDRFIIWSYQECFSIAVHPFLLHPFFCICIAERDKLADYLLVLIVFPGERT